MLVQKGGAIRGIHTARLGKESFFVHVADP
jgi:hypothetical protein